MVVVFAIHLHESVMGVHLCVKWILQSGGQHAKSFHFETFGLLSTLLDVM